MRDVIASCWYVPWLQEGCQDRLAGSASMDGFVYEPIHGQTTGGGVVFLIWFIACSITAVTLQAPHC